MKRVNLGLLASSLMIAACGGGDGGSFGGGQPVSNSFPITVDNGEQATRLSYDAALATGGLAELGSLPIGAAPADGFAIADVAPTADDLMLDVIALIPFGPVEELCPGGGSSFLSGDVEDPLATSPTRGDTYTVEYVNCNDGEGAVLNGMIDLTITEFNGDLFLGLYQLAVDATVTSLEITTASDTVTADGDTAITIDTLNEPVVMTGVSGTQMVQTASAYTQTLTNYSSDQTLEGNLVPQEFVFDASGTLDHTDLPGNVAYSTATAFRGVVGEYPRAGNFLVEGEGSTARLVVIDSTTVRIDIDEDADGTLESSTEMSWDEFLGNSG